MRSGRLEPKLRIGQSSLCLSAVSYTRAKFLTCREKLNRCNHVTTSSLLLLSVTKQLVAKFEPSITGWVVEFHGWFIQMGYISKYDGCYVEACKGGWRVCSPNGAVIEPIFDSRDAAERARQGWQSLADQINQSGTVT